MEDNINEQEDFGEKVYRHIGPEEEQSGLGKILEFLIYGVGLLGTVAALPQAYRIWFLKDVAGLSLFSWISLALFAPFWILYGLLHKKKSLVMTYVVWFMISLVIILGIIYLK